MFGHTSGIRCRENADVYLSCLKIESGSHVVIASGAKQSMPQQADKWIASWSLSSGAHSRDPLARNDGTR